MRARRRRTQPVKNTSPWIRQLLPVTALLCALVLAVTGSKMSLAGLYAYQTEVFATHWHKERRVPAPEEWQRINTAARNAVRLYPVDNAEYLQLLGENWLWRQYEQPMGSTAPAIVRARKEAVKAFTAATTQRPLWPAHWSGLARAQASQLDFSPELTTTLRNAERLGKNRQEVNLQIAELGLLTWQHMDIAAQQITKKAIRHSIQIRPAQLQSLGQLAKQAGNSKAFCQSVLDLPLKGVAVKKAHEHLCSSLPRTL